MLKVFFLLTVYSISSSNWHISFSNQEKKINIFTICSGGQTGTNLPGQKSTNPAPTQHVLPSGQTQAPHPVATSLSAGGLATPSLAVTPSPAGMGQPPTATVPPTLLPVNQLPAQVSIAKFYDVYMH